MVVLLYFSPKYQTEDATGAGCEVRFSVQSRNDACGS
jgi:hypothetical protein